MISRLKIGNNAETYMPVYVKDIDRYLSMLVVGRPGTGKSVSLSNWWLSDCLYGCAKIAIDPSGFLAKDLYSLSKGQALYCSLEHPAGLNPLLEPYSPIQLADNLIEVINQVVSLTTSNARLTAKMRKILTDATLWCLKNNRPSLEAIRDFIAAEKSDAETRDGIVARLGLLVNDDKLKKIICAPETINWKQFITAGQTLILDCFGMGRDKMVFTGCLITHAIKSYFRYTRVKEYRPLIMYVDEAHNFINENHLDVLKEGRKYKLSAILATQDFATIDQTLVKVMLSNIGTLVAFRCGYREASLLAREFQMLTASDLQFPDKYTCAYRTPEEEGIAKSQRPPFVKEMQVESKSEGNISVDPQWFELEPLDETAEEVQMESI